MLLQGSGSGNGPAFQLQCNCHMKLHHSTFWWLGMYAAEERGCVTVLMLHEEDEESVRSRVF